MNNKQLFQGQDAIKDYLNPEHNGLTPLVELPPELNPFLAQGVRIYAKLLSALPLGNSKALAAWQMLEDLDIDLGGRRLIEASSGNTAISLAILGQYFDSRGLSALASTQANPKKRSLLELLGVKLRLVKEDICPDPSDPNSAINKARSAGKSAQFLNLDQYANASNPKAHYRWTGPQLIDQIGSVDIFCAGLGTCGTMVGTGSYLKQLDPNTQNIAVIRKQNNLVPGVRTKNLLRQIDFDWQNIVDAEALISSKEAYRASLELMRKGLMVGPSSGFAYSGLLSYLADNISSIKPRKGQELSAVFVCPDLPYLYIDDYINILGKDGSHQQASQAQLSDQQDLEVEAAQLNDWIEQKEQLLIVDLRDRFAFKEAHIRGAKNISEYCEIKKHLRKAQKCVLVCQWGAASVALASVLQKQGYKAYSLAEGFARWSELDLPREKDADCLLTANR